ncbi:MAG: hypothetical protein FWC42_10465, partial [Proteobacteria bacterium]|nr:hypothetical protein [Pseudomonadota bacterium]
MKATSRIVSIVLAFFLALIFSASAASASGAVADSSSTTVIGYSPSNERSLAAAAGAKATITPNDASSKIIKAQESIAPKGLYDGYTEPITFSGFPAHTWISNQYQSRGIIFSPYFSMYYPYIISPFVYFIQYADNTYDPGLFCVYTDSFYGPDEGCTMSGVFVSPKDPTKKIGAKAIDLWIGGPLLTSNTATLHLYDKSGKQIYETIIDLPPLSIHRENIQSDQEFYFWKITTKNYFIIDNFSVKLAEADVSATIKLEAEAATSPGASKEPVTGKDITVTVDLKDSQGNAVTYPFKKCLWSNIPDSATGQLTYKDGDPDNQCKLTFRYLAKGGASPMTYGQKTIVFIGTIDTDSGEQVVSKIYQFKVFFDKTAKDNGGDTPNWFKYWPLDGAVSLLDPNLVTFDKTLPKEKDENGRGTAGYSTTLERYGVDAIKIGALAAETEESYSIEATDICPGGSFGGVKGINLLEAILAHELRHIQIANNWRPGGIWSGRKDSDCDDPENPLSQKNFWCDQLPDEYETELGTSNQNADSCKLARITPSYGRYGDQEFDARMAERGKKGVAANDWANPGAQTTPAFKSLSIAPKAEGPSY